MYVVAAGEQLSSVNKLSPTYASQTRWLEFKKESTVIRSRRRLIPMSKSKAQI
jgi:hypothetical protein